MTDKSKLKAKIGIFGIGLAAERLGLETAMWLMLAGPLALLIGLPRKVRGES